MLCQKCQSRPATVHSVSIDNGHKHEEHLCEECASAKGFLNISPELGFYKLLPQFFTELNPHLVRGGRACPNCGWVSEEMRRGSKPGCPQCYEEFQQELKPLLNRIHGADCHRGKISLEVKQQPDALESLKNRLAALVEEEKYEEAAGIRDQIRRLEQEKAGGCHE